MGILIDAQFWDSPNPHRDRVVAPHPGANASPQSPFANKIPILLLLLCGITYSMTPFSPVGVYELTPTEANHHQTLTQVLSKGFESAGYAAVRTPVIDDLTSLLPGLDQSLVQSVLPLHHPDVPDAILRPDHTTPIARLVASRMAHQLPVKVYYCAPIFRRPAHDWDAIEQFQAGCEWIGEAHSHADMAILELCVQQLSQLGIQELAIDIGHAQLTRSLSDAHRHALLAGDYAALGWLPQRGGIELAQDIPDLESLFLSVQTQSYASRVHLYQGLTPALSYYTGFVFSVMAPGYRRPIATGGRYDGLMGRFGLPAPAVGFAIHLNDILDHR